MEAPRSQPSDAARSLPPEEALFGGERPAPLLSACDHYAGTERTMDRALQRQRDSGGRFDVTLDLEDGATAGQEREQAARVVDRLRALGEAASRVGVRIHDAASPWWRSDVDTIVRGAGATLGWITLPKCLSARQAAEQIHDIRTVAAEARLGRDIPLHVLIETHGALQDVFRIASLPGLVTLEFGLMDFVSAHAGAIPESAMRSPGQFEHALVRRAKSRITAAAAAAGLVAVHNVTVDLGDPAAAGRDAERARREFGFQRMWSIHPDQIEPILAAFAPQPAETRRAGEVLLAAQAAQWGPIRHEHTLHDRASYRLHWTLLKRARHAGQTLAPEVAAAFFAQD